MLKVFNTLSGQKEEFQPLDQGKVSMYVCGLTVQNYSHLGHLRSALNYDLIRRYLEYKGYQVTYIMNFTDINEKIVARAAEEGMAPPELAEKYTQAYLEDLQSLQIKPATAYVKATENIAAIIAMIEKLIARGYAYQVAGNVYFSVEKFADYGKLSGRNIDQLQAGARIDILEDKQNPLDFALWKRVDDQEISWDSPWGKGWPGWHIECSAMSTKYLGDSFDIHGGGSDLIFPHHENEIAQSEACTGKPFARYWLHNGTVNLKGEKMSKSLGNFYTTRELLKEFRAEEIRYFILTKHYRTPIDFSLTELKQAGVSLKRLVNTVNQLQGLLATGSSPGGNNLLAGQEELRALFKSSQANFEQAMDDDFNSARAIGVLHELARAINSWINQPNFVPDETSKAQLEEGYKLFVKMAGVIGLSLNEKKEAGKAAEDLEVIINFILELREEAREEKNWRLADRIRDRLNQLGYIIKDTPQGVRWERDSEL